MKLLLPLLALFLLLLPGCRRNSAAPLSNEQLLQAMEGYAFDVTLPQDLSEKDTAGLAILRPNGKIERLTENEGWEGVKSVKVVCFPREAGGFRWMFFYDSPLIGRSSMGGRLPQFPKIGGFSVPGQRRFAPGERLMRFNGSTDEKESGYLSNNPGPPTGDDFELIFYVHQLKRP